MKRMHRKIYFNVSVSQMYMKYIIEREKNEKES